MVLNFIKKNFNETKTLGSVRGYEAKLHIDLAKNQMRKYEMNKQKYI